MLDIDVEPVDFWCNHCDSAIVAGRYGLECINCGYDIDDDIHGDIYNDRPAMFGRPRGARPMRTVYASGECL